MDLLGKIVETSFFLGILLIFLGMMLQIFSPYLSYWLMIPGIVLFAGPVTISLLRFIISIWK